MSISETLQSLRGVPKIVLNDKYIGDKGAKQLSKFLQSHKNVQYLQIKNNDISGVGFAEIFKALQKNRNIRQIIIQHNKLGQEGSNEWPSYFGQLMRKNTNIERLNFSNNKINGQTFNQIIDPVCNSNSLKLLQLRYNQIPTSNIKNFCQELKKANNQSLLFVQLIGNKIQKQAINNLQSILKQNRQNNPIPKDNLMMTGGFKSNMPRDQRQFNSQASMSRNNALDSMSKQNILRHLEGILHENRKASNQMKQQLERELSELQRRDKMDVDQINQLDKKCNEMIILNRNLNIQIEKTNLQHKKIQKDQQFQAKIKQERILEANRQLTQMQLKFQDIQNKLNKEHDANIKEITRRWESRVRNIEQKIRDAELDMNTVQNQIVKAVQKRQKLKGNYEEEQRNLRSRIEEQQSQRYRFKIQNLQARIKQVTLGREKFYLRSHEIIHSLQTKQKQQNEQSGDFKSKLQLLKLQQQQLIKKNKNFVVLNEAIKHDIELKQINIEKNEQEINKLNEQIQLKKRHNQQQILKIINNHESDRSKTAGQKQTDIQKLNDLQSVSRNLQLQNAKLWQQYQILQQKLQVSLSKAVQQVFTETNLY